MGASLVSATPKSLYAVSGRNYAPKREIDEFQSSGKPSHNPSTLTSALLTRYNDYTQRDKEAWIECLDTGRMVSNLRTGKLLLMRSVSDGSYLFVKKDGRFSDNKTVGGLFQFYSTKLIAEWLTSRPERDPICPSDDDQIESFIADVKTVQDYYDRRFFNTTYENVECLSAQDYGTWVTRFRFDPDPKVADIICELLDFPACRWDMRFIPEESSYFMYESKCSNAVLENLLNTDVPEESYTDNYGLQQIEQLALTGGNVSGAGKNNPYGMSSADYRNENVVTEMWLQPEAYCDITLTESEPTMGGDTLPKGQRLLEMFPEGMCAVGINGMKTIIAIHAENHKEHIVSGRYHIQSFSGVGKGISDAVDIKKEMDDLHSQTMAYVKAHSTPATYYNQDMISEEQARNIGKPRKIIPVDFTNAPDGVNSINQAIQVVTPQNPAGAIFEYQNTLKDWLQLSMQVTEFANGLPGIDNKTATGARLGDANAAMLLVPQHLNKADHRRRADKVIYNLFKKYVSKDKWFASRKKNWITAGKNLNGAQFNNVDIDFEIVANSEIPQTMMQQQDAQTQMYLQTGGALGFAQLKQIDPDLAGELATAYGAKLSVPKTADIARICRKRINQAKELLNIELKNQKLMMAVGIPPDNTNLATAIVSQVVPPISPLELYGPQKAQWMAELLDADEMQFAPIELRYVVEEMIHRQLELKTVGEAEIAQDAEMGFVMGQLPSLVGEQMQNQHNQALEATYQQQQQQAQMQQQQAQQDSQVAQQQAQAQLQLQTETQKAQIQQSTAQSDFERDKAERDQEFKQTMELGTFEHKNAMELARVQQKNKMAAAKKPAPKK